MQSNHFSFLDWLKGQKILVAWVTFIALMAYGIKVFNYNVSIDTDIMMYDAMGSIKHYIGIQRFGVSFMKMLLSTEIVNPFLLNFLMVVILSAAAIAWCYFFNILSQNNSVFSNCVFSGIFLSHPLMAEQFDFTLQGMEVAMALLIMAPAVYFIYKCLIKKEGKKYLFLGLLLMTWCFGTYQSFFIIYIIGCIVTILFSLKGEKQSNLYWAKTILWEIAVLIIGLILYFIASNIAMQVFDAHSTYLESMLMWSMQPFKVCLENVLTFLKAVVLGEGTFYNKMYILLFVLFISHFILYIKKGVGNRLIYLVCWTGIFISPFLMSIVLGSQEPKRAQFYLPFMLGIGFYYMSLQITWKRLNVLLCAVCLFCSFKQAVVTSRLFYTDFLRFEYDQNLVYEMAQKMGELGFLNNEKKFIVFIGSHRAALNNSAEPGQIIGQSRFATGAPPTGITPNAIAFFRAFGYDFWPSGNEQFEKAIALSKDMTCWPEDGSICCKDGIIVVKLSAIE